MLICKTFAHDHRMKNIDILRMQIASSCWHALYLWPQIKSIKRPNFSDKVAVPKFRVCIFDRQTPWESLQFGRDENKVRIWVVCTLYRYFLMVILTKSSAIAEGPRDTPCLLKPREMSHKRPSNYIW